jgi:hypothetical protein
MRWLFTNIAVVGLALLQFLCSCDLLCSLWSPLTSLLSDQLIVHGSLMGEWAGPGVGKVSVRTCVWCLSGVCWHGKYTREVRISSPLSHLLVVTFSHDGSRRRLTRMDTCVRMYCSFSRAMVHVSDERWRAMPWPGPLFSISMIMFDSW